MQAGELASIKICDFGVSHFCDQVVPGYSYPRAVMPERSGTGHYLAPELTFEAKTKQNFVIGPEIDMWAFGILLFEMATAYKPTQVRGFKYGSGPIPFVPRNWKKLPHNGAEIQNLIEQCLRTDPEERITAKEAMHHAWFNDD